MSGDHSPLTHAEREAAFRIATRSLISWYGDELKRGVTNDRLRELLGKALGVFGGSCSPGRLHVSYQGSGVKVWASREMHNHSILKPILQGEKTVGMARDIYAIPNPADDQLKLI